MDEGDQKVKTKQTNSISKNWDGFKTPQDVGQIVKNWDRSAKSGTSSHLILQ